MGGLLLSLLCQEQTVLVSAILHRLIVISSRAAKL